MSLDTVMLKALGRKDGKERTEGKKQWCDITKVVYSSFKEMKR